MVSATVVTALAGLFIVLRVISRFFVVRSPGAEDWTILGAMALSVGLNISIDLRMSTSKTSSSLTSSRAKKWPWSTRG